ncbi:hypothetical protein D3C76_1680930 [compost metagenome]
MHQNHGPRLQLGGNLGDHILRPGLLPIYRINGPQNGPQLHTVRYLNRLLVIIPRRWSEQRIFYPDLLQELLGFADFLLRLGAG